MARLNSVARVIWQIPQEVVTVAIVISEDRFRYILMVGLFVLMSIGAFHRLSARTGENLDRRQEGLFVLVALRLVALAGMIGLVAYLLNPANLALGAVRLPDWLRWTGVGVGCAALCLVFWTLHSLGRNLTDTVVTRQHHTLVTSGPYRWIRHPFYLCAALVTLAVSLVSANAFFLVTGGLIFLLLAFRTRVEEANLLSRFGEDYRKYMDRTGRFFPRFRDPHSAQLAEELEKLQGTWIQTECEIDGMRNPPEDYGVKPRVTIRGNAFMLRRADGSIAIKGTFAVDPARNPKAIDWNDTFGADAGKTFPAIYALDGDRLIFCAGENGQARPTEFRAGKGQVLRVHQRATS